ncbi:MAG: ribosome silencing factor [Acidobacteria bacterium]|nr:ribosome silencing factor [Acidobacteriota bacterium]
MTETKPAIPENIKDVISLIQDKKGSDITVLKLSEISSFTDYLIICSADSARQAQTICDHIQATLKDRKKKPSHIEGYNMARWILMDYLDFIVNIFHPNTREFYALEKLWHDAESYKPED